VLVHLGSALVGVVEPGEDCLLGFISLRTVDSLRVKLMLIMLVRAEDTFIDLLTDLVHSLFVLEPLLGCSFEVVRHLLVPVVTSIYATSQSSLRDLVSDWLPLEMSVVQD